VATLRDPFTGKFTTRRKYAAAVQRLARLRQKAFEDDNERELARLTKKAHRYLPLDKPRRAEAFAQWEFGVDYVSSRKGGHSVGVNVRLTFDQRVTLREAREALEIIVAGGDVEGASVEAVNWHRPGGRTKSGDERDLQSFADLIATVGVRGLRAGAVKDDDL
jgi:hypothetical protein